MLDIGFFEILIVFIIAILALGPDKLPQFAMDAVKMFKAVKRAITNAQDSIETEINVSDMKADMQKYQQSLSYTENEIKSNNTEKEAKKAIKKLKKDTSISSDDGIDTSVKKSKKKKKDKKDKKDV